MWEIANIVHMLKGRRKRNSGTKQLVWVHAGLPESSPKSVDQKRFIPFGHTCLKLLTAETSLTTTAPLGMVGAEHVSVSSLGWPGWAAGTSALDPSNVSPFPRPCTIKEEAPVGLICTSVCSSNRDPLSWNQVGWEGEMELMRSSALHELEGSHWRTLVSAHRQRPRAEWWMVEPRLRERMWYRDWAHTTDKNKEFCRGES